MKHYSIYCLLLYLFTSYCYANDFKSGDIIFHTSNSSQSRAIQLAMHSPYSHMGMIVFRKDKPFVLEASKTVRFTPLQEWIARGKNADYIVKRLIRDLSKDEIRRLEDVGESLLGKPYDLYFNWTDDRIYCSELVWKIYHRALGLNLGSLQELRQFDITHPHVKKKLLERYGRNIPLHELIISPQAIFGSELLHTVHPPS